MKNSKPEKVLCQWYMFVYHIETKPHEYTKVIKNIIHIKYSTK